MSELPGDDDDGQRRPRSAMEVFRVFNRLALQGFGGVLAVAQRELVERERWMTPAQFLELLSLGQVLPGPNIVNMALMIGDRFLGWRGAAAALAGLMCAPLLIVLLLAALYRETMSQPMVAGALRGMGAVAAGLVIATALKLVGTLRGNPMGLKACALFAAAHAAGHRRAALADGGRGAGAGRCGRGHGLGPDRPMNDLFFGVHGQDSGVLLQLFLHFGLLSLLAIGGAITTAPDMQRYVVGKQGWLSDAQFTSSVAIAQAAPGPNVLFVAVVGWNIAGLAGAAATLAGSLLPSATLALAATRFGDERSDSRGMRAFTAGMAPLTLGLLLATGWILTEPVRDSVGPLLLVPFTVAMMLKTKISPIWLVAVGAVVGALGLAG